LAIDTRTLEDTPRIEVAMKAGGFVLRKELNPDADPGAWIGVHNVPINLMAAESQSGGGRRGVRSPPHSTDAIRKARGLEAALVDKEVHEISSFEEKTDDRKFKITVAGPAALVVAKLLKIGERQHQQSGRLKSKDALDLFYLLQAKSSKEIAERMIKIESDAVSNEVATQAIELLSELFGSPDALGGEMAVEASGPLANHATIRESLVILANDLPAEIENLRLS
jgi:hypothetical protein